MALRFNWKQVSEKEMGLTFDDVLIIPNKSDMKSRREPNLKSRLTKKIEIDIPIISANMDTVTESEMAIAMMENGAFGILHRFISIPDQVLQVEKVRAHGFKNISASIGISGDWQERSEALVKAGVNILTLDIAHGHAVAMLDTMKWLKDKYSNVELIAGNTSTPEGVYDLIQAGADAVKIGIGPGSMCTTRIITGCGVPQFTAIALCAEVAKEHGVPLIADGGIRTSGDMVKAFAAGADTVMLGSMLAGTIETPGEIKSGKKQYRGMASKAAQVSWRGGVPEGMAAEGESTMVNVKGHVKDVVHELSGGIRSGMTYINASSITEICERATFMQMSNSGVRESHAHGLNQK